MSTATRETGSKGKTSPEAPSQGTHSPKTIEFKVSCHPGGNRTLMERVEGAGWSDVMKPETCANKDKATFYRAVAKHIAEQAQTHRVTKYDDWHD